jgi:hypothetical protein
VGGKGMENDGRQEYTIKEYAEFKGLKLRMHTRALLGRNAEKLEKSGKFDILRKWKHEKDMFLRGKKKIVDGRKIYVPFKRQPGVRVWTLEILKEVFDENTLKVTRGKDSE